MESEDVFDLWPLIRTAEDLAGGGYDTAVHARKRLGFGDAGVN